MPTDPNILSAYSSIAPQDATSVGKVPMSPVDAGSATGAAFSWKPDNSSPDTSTISISDNRKIDAASGTMMNDTNRLHSNVDKETIEHIVKAAKQSAIDPYTALAIALQETGINMDEDNPLRVRIDQYRGIPEDKIIENSMAILRDKFRIAKSRGKTDEADVLQAWNGYGKVGSRTEGDQKMMYGIDVSKTPIDMNTNPVYGKRIIDLRENVIKKNPDLVKLIESIQ